MDVCLEPDTNLTSRPRMIAGRKLRSPEVHDRSDGAEVVMARQRLFFPALLQSLNKPPGKFASCNFQHHGNAFRRNGYGVCPTLCLTPSLHRLIRSGRCQLCATDRQPRWDKRLRCPRSEQGTRPPPTRILKEIG